MGGLTFYQRNRDRNFFCVAIFTISLNPIFFLLPLYTPCWNKHCSSYIFFWIFCNANGRIIPNRELSLGLLFPIFSTIGKQRKGLFYSNYLTHQNKLRQPITIHTSSVCTQPNDVPLMNINPPAYHHHLYFGNPPWGEVDENMVAFPFCAYYYIHMYIPQFLDTLRLPSRSHTHSWKTAAQEYDNEKLVSPCKALSWIRVLAEICYVGSRLFGEGQVKSLDF